MVFIGGVIAVTRQHSRGYGAGGRGCTSTGRHAAIIRAHSRARSPSIARNRLRTSAAAESSPLS